MAMLGTQRSRKPTSEKQPSLAPDKATKAARDERRRELARIDDQGTKPTTGSQFFLAHNKDFYNVPVSHVVSCEAPVVGDPANLTQALLMEGARARSTEQRKLAYINAGHAVGGNPDAGKSFWGRYAPDTGALTDWEWEPTPEEQYEVHWIDPVAKVDKKTGEVLKRDHTKIPTEMQVGTTPIYSKADILARYMGHKALNTSATTAFATHVLGVPHDYRTGKNCPTHKPTDKQAPNYAKDMEAWSAERNQIAASLRKIYLVYPHAVDPVFGPLGCVYAKGAVSAALKSRGGAGLSELKPAVWQHTDAQGNHYEDVAGTEFAGDFAPQPVIFCTLDPDRRPGAPNSERAGGYHDSTRANALTNGVLDLIKHFIRHYKLETNFPALLTLHAQRSSALLNLEHFRSVYAKEIGKPPGEDHDEICPEWAAKWAAMPFGKVWVQHCDQDHPFGEVEFGTDKPKLVPLLKGRAEERNGVRWLDVTKIERSASVAMAQHYIAIQDALGKVLGKAWDKKGTDRRAALAGAYCAEGLARARQEQAAEDGGGVEYDVGLPAASGKKRRARAKQDADFLDALAPGGAGASAATRAIVVQPQRDAENAALRREVKELKEAAAAEAEETARLKKRARRNYLVLNAEQAKPGRVFFKEFDSKVQLILPEEGRGALVVRVWRHDSADGPEELRVRPDDEVELDFSFRPAAGGGGAAPRRGAPAASDEDDASVPGC